MALFIGACALRPTLRRRRRGGCRGIGRGSTGAEAQRLGWQLGMKVSIDAVAHPRPGVVRYEGLVLANPETGEEVAHCRSAGERPGAVPAAAGSCGCGRWSRRLPLRGSKKCGGWSIACSPAGPGRSDSEIGSVGRLAGRPLQRRAAGL